MGSSWTVEHPIRLFLWQYFSALISLDNFDFEHNLKVVRDTIKMLLVYWAKKCCEKVVHQKIINLLYILLSGKAPILSIINSRAHFNYNWILKEFWVIFTNNKMTMWRSWQPLDWEQKISTLQRFTGIYKDSTYIDFVLQGMKPEKKTNLITTCKIQCRIITHEFPVDLKKK